MTRKLQASVTAGLAPLRPGYVAPAPRDVTLELRALRLAVAKLTKTVEDLQTTMIVFADCGRK